MAYQTGITFITVTPYIKSPDRFSTIGTFSY